MKQTIEIEVPNGKKAIWKDSKIIFEDIKSQLPKTWEEFCEQNPIKKTEKYIDLNSEIDVAVISPVKREFEKDRNILPSKEAAEAHLALMQLHQLRDCYRQGWIPDWTSGNVHYCITKVKNILKVGSSWQTNYFLSFPTLELAQQFLDNFRDLIEQVEDLI